MVLSDADGKRFINLYHLLLFYVNNKQNVLEDLHQADDLYKKSPDDLIKLKESLYASPDQIDSFLKENQANLAAEDREIISAWRHFLKGEFYVVRYLKDYAVFLSKGIEPKAYGVVALAVPWEDLLGPTLPRVVVAVLLPFEDKIIFDGTFSAYNIYFGSGMKRSINDDLRQAKNNYGIITSLPFNPEKGRPTDADILRGYLSSQDSRDIHWNEIEELMEKNPELLAVYSEEMGKVHARTYRKRLKGIGVKSGWFGIIDGMIIASGSTHQDVDDIVNALLPQDKRRLVYIFQIKSK